MVRYKTGDEVLMTAGRHENRMAVVSMEVSRGVYLLRLMNGVEFVATVCEFERVAQCTR